MFNYGIGLNVGVGAIGWSVVALDVEDNPMGIIDMGVRSFPPAEHPKTGASLAAPRQEARSHRRVLRRHRHRNERIRHLIVNSGLLNSEELKHLYDTQSDIYELRANALDRPVTPDEFARILINLSQRRGFKSNRKNIDTDTEVGNLLAAVNDNKLRMAEHGWRTVGEMLYKDDFFAQQKRNADGKFLSTVSRDMVEDEVRTIFAAQRKFGVEFATADFEDAFLNILLSQRSFDEGPGENSPYSGNQIEKQIGHCLFEPEQLRAAKATFSFEYSNLLQKINNIKLIKNGNSTPLTAIQRKHIIDLAFNFPSLTYSRIRKELGISDDLLFNMLQYDIDGNSIERVEKKEKFCYLKAYHEICKAFSKSGAGSFKSLTKEQLNTIGTILTKYKTDDKIRQKLVEAGITNNNDIISLQALSFSSYGKLSVKALDKIIPFLEQGMKYSDACKAAGYNFKGHDKNQLSKLLPAFKNENNEITNPVVMRAVSQTIKVINAIIREQEHSPTYINIEMARELSKNFVERQKLKREMDKNRNINEELKEQIKKEFGIFNPSGYDIAKLKLYKEQNGFCAYSLKPIEAKRLFEPGYAEIDHIIPYSVSFDDRYSNKVLVLTSENRNKGTLLPMEYLHGESKDNFVKWVAGNVKNYQKKVCLLSETLSREQQEKFKMRNLKDTQYISRFMLNYIKDNLEFSPYASVQKSHVTAVNGIITAYLRKRWGIVKNRDNGELHYCVDALVTACVTDDMIRRISKYSHFKECHYMPDEEGFVLCSVNNEIIDHFPYPWSMFKKELEARLGNNPSKLIADLKIPFYMHEDAPQVRKIFVSRMPNRKISGAAHQDTARSPKHIDTNQYVVKEPLTKLKLDSSGEIDGYLNPQNDPYLYKALKAQLLAFDGNAQKAFAEPFYKPNKHGEKGTVVKAVNILKKTTLYVPIQQGTAISKNATRVRVDVFKTNNHYYFVPIYLPDTLKDELPNKACAGSSKPYAEWPEMLDADFVFSLYDNDIIKISRQKEIILKKVHPNSDLPDTCIYDGQLMYFKGLDIAGASLTLVNHDNSYFVKALGTYNLTNIEKYTVDVLGHCYPVKQEQRQPFNFKRK